VSVLGNKEGVPLRNDANLEQEMDNLAFAAQRDLLLLRLARMQSLPDEEKRKRCLASLSKLRDLLTEIEAFLNEGLLIEVDVRP
jgi:hypothetical protein